MILKDTKCLVAINGMPIYLSFCIKGVPNFAFNLATFHPIQIDCVL